MSGFHSVVRREEGRGQMARVWKLGLIHFLFLSLNSQAAVLGKEKRSFTARAWEVQGYATGINCTRKDSVDGVTKTGTCERGSHHGSR